MAHSRPYSRLGALWLFGGLLWAAGIAVGTHALVRYENTEGTAGNPPSRWPRETQIPRRDGRFSLVMFAHPDCSCTRASLAELDTLPAALRAKLDTFLEIRKPGLALQDAKNSELWHAASAIPGLSIALDGDGRETHTFGAAVSGQTMLYDESGDLVFSGGLTGARGHIGDNLGIQAVFLRIAAPAGAHAAPVDHMPVFGCSLLDPTGDERAKDPAWKKP